MTNYKKNILSILLIISLMLPLMAPTNTYAQSANMIRYTYKSGIGNEQELSSIFMRINTVINTLGTHNVTILTDGGDTHNIGKVTIEPEDRGVNIPRSFEMNNPRNNLRIVSIFIADFELHLDPAPMITRMSTYDINVGDHITFTGERLNVPGTEVHISGEDGIFYAYEPNKFIQIMNGTIGFKRITIETTDPYANTTQSAIYPDAFKLLGDMPQLGRLEIIPGMGAKESIAYIKAEGGFTIKDGEPLHSVFFLQDQTDKHTIANMAEILSAAGNIMKIKIPKGIADARYYDVIVANNIANPRGNINEQIIETKKVASRFFVIGADVGPILTRIDPPRGADTGGTVQITGRKFDEVDFIDGIENHQGITIDRVFIDDKSMDDMLDGILDAEVTGMDKKEDKVFHVKYQAENARYNNSNIISMDRYIATYIGDRTTPHATGDKPDYRFTGDFDDIRVKLPQTSVNRETPVNVVIIMQTEIRTYSREYTIINIISDDKIRYTIIPSYTAPSINGIVPEKIQVIEDKAMGDYVLKNDMVMGIEGQNFKVIRDRDTSINKDITSYPVVGLGGKMDSSEEGMVLRINPEREGQVEIYRNGNWAPVPGADMVVLDAKGNIIDGTVGKDTGNRIIITIPRSAGIRIPAGGVTNDLKNPIPKPVYIMNPILGSREPGYAMDNPNVTMMFMDLKDGLPPTIDQVSPNVVAIDAGEEITVTGSNFQAGIRVLVGGMEVSGVKHELGPEGMHTVLKFNAPKFPKIIEGSTKLTIMNPDGGQASRDFTYVKSLQRDPVLTDFSPKKGTYNTTVVVDGDNFLVPNPAVSSIAGIGIYRLIGSRILMDGKDINEYNASNGSITLKEYSNDEHIIEYDYESNNINLSDYHYSIILEEENRPNNFYTIYKDSRGNIILSDGGSGGEQDSMINAYYITERDGRLIGEKNGHIYEVNTVNNGIELIDGGQITKLIMKTPYKFASNGDIYGSRVHIIDKNRIEFTVPQLTSKQPDGYRITIENPDTKKSTAKNLFYYYESVSLSPSIHEIKPSIGSVEGGYQILIAGENFEDDSKVYIDGALVAAKDVKRETILGRDTLVISKMPPYKRNMAEEETDRKVVPIVVENGNGGTAIGRFTYVIPSSAKPIIDKAELQKESQVASAAGDEILVISGRYFKFEEPWSLSKKYMDWIEGIRNGTRVYFEDLDGDGFHTSYINWRDYIEKGGELGELPVPVETYERYLKSKILPKVRIGGIEANIVEFGTNYIKVITPQIAPGRHELYVVNNDFGTSNRVTISFEGSRVSIDRIVGDTGRKQGRDSVTILGSGFQNSRINVFENNNIKEYYMPRVRFGTIGGIKDINNNRAQVVLEDGDFVLEYDSSSNPTQIKLTVKYGKDNFTKTFAVYDYNKSPIYFPIWELKSSNGKAYPGYELISIEEKNRKLIVEKGYAPESELISSGQVALKTPSYYTVGNVQVELANPDGGKAVTKYRYTNPASKPRIINITKDGMNPSVGDDGETMILRLDYRGGQYITVLGEDFREGARIQIGEILNIDNRNIVETLDIMPNKLAFTIPKVNENIVGKLYRVTIINGDGAQASSDERNNIWNAPIYLQFIKGESDPELSNIEPSLGPATGGTRVTIKGKDFRDSMEGYEGDDLKVFFGDKQVPEGDIKAITHGNIELITPESSTFGPVRVKIENPDGSLTQQNIIFTYISKPRIDDGNPKKLFSNDTNTEVTIKGAQFMQGAKVIMGGRIIPTKDVKSNMDVKGQGIAGVDLQGNNREVSVIGGMEAASVNVTSNSEMKLRFRETTDLKNSSIIIINPDGGISDPYEDIKHERPLPLKPMVLEGIPGFESTVMLIWNESDPELLNSAAKYEIYGGKSLEKTNTFVGTTADASYLINNLEPNTEYIFLVRALNQYGAALDFAEVKVKTLSLQEDYKQREREDKLKQEQKKFTEKGKEETIGNRLIKTIGSEDIAYNVGNLDFNQSKHKNTNELLINIPLSLARMDSMLNIRHGELEMSVNPKDLYTFRVSSMDKGDKDSNLQIHINRLAESNIPRGKKIASRAYDFYFSFQNGKDIMDIDILLRNGRLTLNLDSIIYSNAKNVKLYVFNPPTGEYVKASDNRMTPFNSKGRYILLSDR